MNKKKYMTPQTEILDIETNDVLAGSPPSEITDPTIGESRELYDALWGDEED